MSGMSEGGVSSRWYSLEVYGGISFEPAEGSEEVIYGGLREEGDEFTRALEPYREKFDEIVFNAKQEFSAPIVAYERGLENGYVDGAIIEDVPEFDSTSLSPGIDPEIKKEKLLYEKQKFQKILAEEPAMKEHFTIYFKKGSHIYVEFAGHLPGDIRSYKFILVVDNRIKRSTLNWIRDKINPYIVKALNQ